MYRRVIFGKVAALVCWPSLFIPPTGDADVAAQRIRALDATVGRCAEASSTALLENRYWKLVRVGDETVVAGNGQREPHLILHRENKRVSGFGGCNVMTANYEQEGDRLTFDQLGGTIMACPKGMEQESALQEALMKVARWRVSGERLELLDADGNTLVQLESRYM
jgi:heat shock protein HslJ